MASVSEQQQHQQFKIRMLRFYVVYCPEKMTEADGLKDFPGKEEEILRAMATKYGPAPSDEQVVEACKMVPEVNVKFLLSLPSSRPLREVQSSIDRNKPSNGNSDTLPGGDTPPGPHGCGNEDTRQGRSEASAPSLTLDANAGSTQEDSIDSPNQEELVVQRSCCCYMKCCPTCMMHWRCVKHHIKRDVHPKYVGLVRFGLFIWVLLIFCLSASVASFLYTMAVIDKTFSSLHVTDFFDSRYSFQFGVATAGLFGGPVLMFFWFYYTLYSALEFHQVKGQSVGSSDDPTSVIQHSGQEVDSLLSQFSASDQLAAYRSRKSSGMIQGSDSKGLFLVGKSSSGEEKKLRPDLKFAHRRRLLLTLSLFACALMMSACIVTIIGPHPWPCPGIIFMLQVHHQIVPLYQKSGIQSPTFGRVFWTTVALPVATCGLWGIFFTLLGVMFYRVSRVLKNVFAVGAAILFGLGVLIFALLITFLNTGGVASNPFGIPSWNPRPDVVRGLCFKNSCGFPVRIGQVGGSTGIPCHSSEKYYCPNGTICNTKNVGEHYCYFQLSLPAGENLFLGPHGSYCYPFINEAVTTRITVGGHIVDNLVQWSGSIYASTGCGAGGTKCKTGICNDCEAYEGPIGPVTTGEFTLQVHGLDYYDVTVINGMNVPLSVTPQFPTGTTGFAPNPQPSPPQTSAYYCKSPGSVVADGLTPAATWKFKPPTSQYNLIASGGVDAATKADANTGAGCACGTKGMTCGVSMGLNQDNLPLPDIKRSQCGELVGLWTDDELCAWTAALTTGKCSKALGNIVGQTYRSMFACDSGFSTSCFQPTSGSNCCGCTTWSALNLSAVLKCHEHSAVWMDHAYPKLKFLKEACPTCYTYPFDDATSLFTCQSRNIPVNFTNTSNTTGGGGEPTESPSLPVNNNRYQVEFCPNGVELASEPES